MTCLSFSLFQHDVFEKRSTIGTAFATHVPSNKLKSYPRAIVGDFFNHLRISKQSELHLNQKTWILDSFLFGNPTDVFPMFLSFEPWRILHGKSSPPAFPVAPQRVEPVNSIVASNFGLFEGDFQVGDGGPFGEKRKLEI